MTTIAFALLSVAIVFADAAALLSGVALCGVVIAVAVMSGYVPAEPRE